jgi:secreted trypsin-like serine protease
MFSAHRVGFSLVFASIVGTVGCAGDAGFDPEEVDETSDELIGGVEVAANIQTPTVYFRGTTGACTGARVGTREILTAAHCVTDERGAIEAGFAAGASVSYTNAKVLDGTVPFELGTVDRTLVHTTWSAGCPAIGCNRINAPMTSPFPQDIAIIRFRSPLAANIPTAQVDTGSVSTSTTVTMMGYGCEQTYDGPAPNPRRMKRYLTNPLPTEQVNVPNAIVPNAQLNAFGGRYALTPGRTYPSPTGASLCPGDSGGPLYRGSALSRRVVGVHASVTFGNNDTQRSRTNVHTRASGAVAWLKANLPASQVL